MFSQYFLCAYLFAVFYSYRVIFGE